MTKNKKSIAACICLLWASNACAQDPTGTISGQVTGPFDGMVADAPIQVTHIVSGERWRSRSDSAGRFEFAQLPSGDYLLQINIGCCEYKPYRYEPIDVKLGSNSEFDIELEQGFQLNTIGDDFAIATAQILAERDVPDLPIPRTDAGKPNLTGMWVYGADPFPIGPKFNEQSAKLVAERVANNSIESPRIR